MVKEIRMYIEGGDGAESELRRGFREFFRELAGLATSKGIRFQIIAGGSRSATFDAFKRAITQHKEAFNILLIDSEDPVHASPWQHLRQRQQDTWSQPAGTSDDQCHLMVQSMESWIIADVNTLRSYYGQKFVIKQIFKNPNVEQIDQRDLASALFEATRHTQKGRYHKIRHAADLLARVDVSIVRRAAPHCDRLFVTLIAKMNEQ